MLLSPVIAALPSAVAPSASPGIAGRRRGGPDGDGSAAAGSFDARLSAEPSAIAEGGCCVQALALDPSCAAAARRTFREVAALLGLGGDLLNDGITMTSELAANTLHAHQHVEVEAGGSSPVAGGPELWFYLRQASGRWELVCKVFDSLCGWKSGRVPVPGSADPYSVSGRGLQVVAGLSGGRWGYHETRARLGSWKVPGKAVWFSLAVPPARVPVRLRCARIAPIEAGRVLEHMLADRGLGEGLLRVEEPATGISVLSLRLGLTVWCRPGVIRWQTRRGSYAGRRPTDLVDVAEEIVRACSSSADGGLESSVL